MDALGGRPGTPFAIILIIYIPCQEASSGPGEKQTSGPVSDSRSAEPGLRDGLKECGRPGFFDPPSRGGEKPIKNIKGLFRRKGR